MLKLCMLIYYFIQNYAFLEPNSRNMKNWKVKDEPNKLLVLNDEFAVFTELLQAKSSPCKTG